ncbi:MAG TPA: EAL domain-containing protein [Xanthobacteraceae bacterium]|nr:EAL domain-containing protein [Xanthobacteraceae bacterium]
MPPRHQVVFRHLFWVVIGLMALALLAIGITAWSLRSDQTAAGVRETDRFAKILASQTERSVESIDAVLREVQARIDALRIETPADLRRASSEEMFAFLKGRQALLPQAAVIAIAGSDGTQLNTTRRWPAPGVHLSDRAFFQEMRKADDSALHISLALKSQTVGTPTIFFNRRINTTRGEFAGTIGVGVEITYFRDIYESIGTVEGQSFLMLRRDGTIIWRYPDPAPRVGLMIPHTSGWHEVVARGGGNFRAPGSFDGEPRLVAVRPLAQYPLVIDVALSEATVTATWNRRMAVIGAGTLLVVCCAAFLLRAMARQFEQLVRSEAALEAKTHELEEANARLDAAISNLPQGLCMFDAAERLVVANARYLDMYGLADAGIAPGTPLIDMLRRRQALGNLSVDPERYLADLRRQLARGKTSYAVAQLPDGRVAAVQNQPVAGGGWVAMHEDITERQRAAAQVAHMARHDHLTDLPNRAYFGEKMQDALDALDVYGRRFNVLLFDLDLFKAVNDSLGHPVGDELLKLIAQRLRGCLDENCTVARFGGDEFAILQISEADQQEDAIVLATRLQSILSEPYYIEGHQIVIGISTGIALAPGDGTTQVELLKCADLALYRAKSEGRKGHQFYASEMDADARLRRALEFDLRDALARGQFALHYQTIIDVPTQRVCGAEALVRWKHPTYGLVPPDRFISIAEESGLIVPIGEWILRTACAEAAKWPAHVNLAVNLSPVQFQRGDLVSAVTRALAESGLSPSRLEVEITESVLLQKNAENLAVLHQLKALGIGIVLDDFGTGYSSLSYLRMFPFDKIKIDKSFVAEFSDRADCAAIVCAVTGLGRSLNVETTGEGVETTEQFELLRAAGCTQVQGYLFNRPLPAEELDFSTRGAERMHPARIGGAA